MFIVLLTAQIKCSGDFLLCLNTRCTIIIYLNKRIYPLLYLRITIIKVKALGTIPPKESSLFLLSYIQVQQVGWFLFLNCCYLKQSKEFQLAGSRGRAFSAIVPTHGISNTCQSSRKAISAPKRSMFFSNYGIYHPHFFSYQFLILKKIVITNLKRHTSLQKSTMAVWWVLIL